MAVIGESARVVTDLLNLLQQRDLQIGRLISKVRDDRDIISQDKRRVKGLLDVATAIAKRGACLALKSFRRGRFSRTITKAFHVWKYAFQAAAPSIIEQQQQQQQQQQQPEQNPQTQQPTQRSREQDRVDEEEALLEHQQVWRHQQSLEEEAQREEEEKNRQRIEGENEEAERRRKETIAEVVVPVLAETATSPLVKNEESIMSDDLEVETLESNESSGNDEASKIVSGNEEDKYARAAAAQSVWALVPANDGTGDSYWWNRSTNFVTWDVPAEIEAMMLASEVDDLVTPEAALTDPSTLSTPEHNVEAAAEVEAEASLEVASISADNSIDEDDAKIISSSQEIQSGLGHIVDQQQQEQRLDDEEKQDNAAAESGGSTPDKATREPQTNESTDSVDDDAAEELSTLVEASEAEASETHPWKDDAPPQQDDGDDDNDDTEFEELAAADAAAQEAADEEEAEKARLLKVEWDRAAAAALTKNRQIFEAEQKAAAAKKREVQRRSFWTVPEIARRILAKHEPEIREVILCCDDRRVDTDSSSAVECVAAMRRWEALRDVLLREGELLSTTDEPEMQQEAPQLAGSSSQELQDAEGEQPRRRHECVLAASVTAEVLEKAILGIGCFERHLVQRALPLISGQSLVGALPDRPMLLELAATPAPAPAERVPDIAPFGSIDDKPQTLVDYIATLVKHFERKSGEALPGEIASSVGAAGGANPPSKKRQKGGPAKTPRPINHSVLSSPIVLKAAREFHPKTNALVLGEFEAIARLADDTLLTLCDEVLVEIYPEYSSILLQIKDEEDLKNAQEMYQNGTGGSHHLDNEIAIDNFGDLQIRGGEEEHGDGASGGLGSITADLSLPREREVGDPLEAWFDEPRRDRSPPPSDTPLFDPLGRFTNNATSAETQQRSGGSRSSAGEGSAYLDLAL